MKKTFFTIAVALLAFAGTAFAQAGAYSGNLDVMLNIPAGDAQPTISKTINLIDNTSSYTLEIQDFALGVIEVGTVSVPNVTISGGVVSAAKQMVTVHVYENDVPVYITIVSGTLVGDALNLTLKIENTPMTAGMLDIDVDVVFAGTKTTGIFSASAEALSVSPTLVSDVISVPAQNGAAYVVYNQAGAAVAAGSVSGSSVNVSSLAAGVYVLSVDGKTAKFVKK